MDRYLSDTRLALWGDLSAPVFKFAGGVLSGTFRAVTCGFFTRSGPKKISVKSCWWSGGLALVHVKAGTAGGTGGTLTQSRPGKTTGPEQRTIAMGYTPKHAKPASLNNNATANRRHALFAINGPSRGRHAVSSNARQTAGTAAPELRSTAA